MLQMILGAVLIAATILLWLPTVSEALCLLVRFFRPPAMVPSTAAVPRLLFIVPAHNEELHIEACVRSLLEMDYSATARRIVVVADNCTDATARIVRGLGAECLERVDAALPGKPRAIAWTLARFELSHWDACVIVDADSVVAPEFAQGLAKLAPLNDIAFQANIGALNEFDGWLTRLGGLLSRCRYEITYPLKQSAGLNCPIMGNGMGFGTNVLIQHGWRSFSITEDSELYAIYTAMGLTIRHAAAANLFAQEERSLEGGVTQRRRWLGGRLRVIRDWGWRILQSPQIGWRQKLDAFVELGLASPVIHLILALTVVVAALAVLPTPLGSWIGIGAAASLFTLLITTIAALVTHPQPWRTISSFAMLPVYAGWRAVVLLRTLITIRDTTWRRTNRTASPVPMINPRA